MIQKTKAGSLFTANRERKVPLEGDRVPVRCLKVDNLTCTKRLANWLDLLLKSEKIMELTLMSVQTGILCQSGSAPEISKCDSALSQSQLIFALQATWVK